MGISIQPVCPAIGVEIKDIDLSQPLDHPTADAIIEAFHEHILLLFRDQDITVEQQTTFATTFGELGKRTKAIKDRKTPDDLYTSPIMLVTNILKENGEPLGGAAAFGDSEMWFHHDTCFYEVPNIITMLYGMQITSFGGHTKVANMYRAYENIPADLKQRIEGKKVLQIHDFKRFERIDMNGDISHMRQFVQPMVITHPATGRKALYINRLMTGRIEGMEQEESDHILNQLFDIAEDPSIHYEHEWRVGDLLMWDNRVSMHARTDFPSEEHRLLRRCTVAGTEPMHA